MNLPLAKQLDLVKLKGSSSIAVTCGSGNFYLRALSQRSGFLLTGLRIHHITTVARVQTKVMDLIHWLGTRGWRLIMMWSAPLTKKVSVVFLIMRGWEAKYVMHSTVQILNAVFQRLARYMASYVAYVSYLWTFLVHVFLPAKLEQTKPNCITMRLITILCQKIRDSLHLAF